VTPNYFIDQPLRSRSRRDPARHVGSVYRADYVRHGTGALPPRRLRPPCSGLDRHGADSTAASPTSAMEQARSPYRLRPPRRGLDRRVAYVCHGADSTPRRIRPRCRLCPLRRGGSIAVSPMSATARTRRRVGYVRGVDCVHYGAGARPPRRLCLPRRGLDAASDTSDGARSPHRLRPPQTRTRPPRRYSHQEYAVIYRILLRSRLQLFTPAGT
jgi:hypothetical protein